MNRITFCAATVKHFEQELQKAYQRGDQRLICKIAVLLATNRQKNCRKLPGCGGLPARRSTLG